eukprot:scaffold3842_cov158-Amphora_coffeaeformis.AAC.7
MPTTTTILLLSPTTPHAALVEMLRSGGSLGFLHIAEDEVAVDAPTDGRTDREQRITQSAYVESYVLLKHTQ